MMEWASKKMIYNTMKHIKLFEEFIREDAMSPNKESDVVIDDIKLENGKNITAAEIVGAIINTDTEKEIEEFFYGKYGQNAFKAGEMETIKKYWNEYQAEEKEAEAEDEGGEDGEEEEDPLADL